MRLSFQSVTPFLTPFTKRLCAVALVCGALVVVPLTAGDHPNVHASIVEQSELDTAGAQATFKISVTNSETVAMTHFYATFADDTSVSLGDVAAGATVESAAVTRSLEADAHGSRNIPVKVTLKFQLDGRAVEVPWILTLARK